MLSDAGTFYTYWLDHWPARLRGVCSEYAASLRRAFPRRRVVAPQAARLNLVTFEDLSSAAQLVEKAVARVIGRIKAARQGAEKRPPRVHIVQAKVDDFRKLFTPTRSSARPKSWPAVERAQAGDVLIFYVGSPKSAFVGEARVVSVAPQERRAGGQAAPYHATIEKLKHLPTEVPLEAARRRFLARWPFLRAAQGRTTVPNGITAAFLRFVRSAPRLERANSAAVAQAATEGLATEIRSIRRHRNNGLRLRALARAKDVCEGCQRDFSRLLDGLGRRALQVHHRRQLALRTMPELTKPDDLAVLCANCHALVHATTRPMPVERLRGMLAKGDR